MRTTALASIAVTLLLQLGCGPDRTLPGADVPEGTPSCEEACNLAWPCGGVLENDLETCVAVCDDASDNDADYRICVNETACEDMGDCKVYGPSGEPPAEE